MTLANFTNTANSFVTGYGWSITSPSTATAISGVTTSTGNSTWFLPAIDVSGTYTGATRPMLMSEAFTAINNPLPITNAHQLQLMSANLNNNYVLGSNVDLTNALSNVSDVFATNFTTPTGSGFMPVGDGVNTFNGAFNGNGYFIIILYQSRIHNLCRSLW